MTNPTDHDRARELIEGLQKFMDEQGAVSDDGYEYIAAALSAARAEQMERDCAAMCFDCAMKGKPELVYGKWIHTKYNPAVCMAAPIRQAGGE